MSQIPPSEEAGSSGGGATSGLRSWWAPFTRTRMPSREGAAARPARDTSIFGAQLHHTLRDLSVAISLADKDGQPFVWGYVPMIVAKIGIYLKENATEVEGVFRVGGSEKRMKELTEVFDSPPYYGRNVDWSKYTVHDAAGLLRRYLNQLPGPIIPTDMYQEFRNVLAHDRFDPESTIRSYRLLITSMPSANQYLLLYVLDLLAVFDRRSEVNLMTANNLAIIFQPAILNNPALPTNKEDHALAVQVIEFLIKHQDHFFLALSPPPPPNLRPEQLSSVSQPITDEDHMLVPSDSDEDLGEMEVHQGGGALLARRNSGKPTPRTRERSMRGFFGGASDDNGVNVVMTQDESALPRRPRRRPSDVQRSEPRSATRKRTMSHSTGVQLSRDQGASSSPSATTNGSFLQPPQPMRPPMMGRSVSASSWTENLGGRRPSLSRRKTPSDSASGVDPVPSASSSPGKSMRSSRRSPMLPTPNLAARDSPDTLQPSERRTPAASSESGALMLSISPGAASTPTGESPEPIRLPGGAVPVAQPTTVELAGAPARSPLSPPTNAPTPPATDSPSAPPTRLASPPVALPPPATSPHVMQAASPSALAPSNGPEAPRQGARSTPVPSVPKAHPQDRSATTGTSPRPPPQGADYRFPADPTVAHLGPAVLSPPIKPSSDAQRQENQPQEDQPRENRPQENRPQNQAQSYKPKLRAAVITHSITAASREDASAQTPPLLPKTMPTQSREQELPVQPS